MSLGEGEMFNSVGEPAYNPPVDTRAFRMRISTDATTMIRVRMQPATSRGGVREAQNTLDHERKLPDAATYNHEGIWHVYPTDKPKRETTFGARAKQTIREFGAYVDEEFSGSKGGSVFCTLTLPTTDERVWYWVARYSPRVVACIMQWLRDVVGEVHYAWVWEWQKRGALHLHLVAASRNWVGLGIVLSRWKEYCRDLLQNLEKGTGFDFFQNTETGENHRYSDDIQMDAQATKKSAARYLAKYMGKRKQAENRSCCYSPVRWWRVSNNALPWIRSRRSAFVVSMATDDERQTVLESAGDWLSGRASEFYEYANARFPWMKNLVVLSDSKQQAAQIMDGLRARLQQYMVYPESPTSAGGGGTRSTLLGEGVGGITYGAGTTDGADCMATFSEVFTFMNSIFCVSPSSA